MKICVFYCSNSLAGQDLAHFEAEKGCDIKAISLPCSGKIDIPYMTKAFETGADGVVIITCPESQCHNLEGNLRARKRAQAVDSLLEEVGLGTGRIEVIQLTDGGIEQVMKYIRSFCTGISRTTSRDTENIKSSNSEKNAKMSMEKST